MYNKGMLDKIFKITILVFTGVFIIFTGLYVFDITNRDQREINVLGTGTETISNQIAEFTITFTTENSDKSKSESLNNDKVKKFLESIRQFGIEEKHIMTSQINSYQKQESDINPPYRSRLTDWVYTQSITVKVVDVAKVNDFVALVGKNETSNTWGPNFTTDLTTINEDTVFQKAFDDAKARAERLAKFSGKKIGRVIYIQESDSYNTDPILRSQMSGMGGASSSSPEVPAGSSEITKTLSVTFELR